MLFTYVCMRTYVLYIYLSIYLSIIDECHLRFCSCCSCGFLLCLCSFSLVFGKPNAIDHPQVMTMFMGVKHPPSFQSESKHTVQVETWSFVKHCLFHCLHPGSLYLGTSPVSFFAWNNRRNVDVSCLQLFVLDLLPDFFSWQEQSQRKRPSCMFSSNNFRKTKTAMAPLAAKIVQHYGPQQIRHNMLELSRIARFRSTKCEFVWQSLAAQELGWGDEGQTIHQFDLRTLLDRRLLLLDCDCELLPSCTKTFPQTSLPKISVQPASRKSHCARRSTNFN